MISAAGFCTSDSGQAMWKVTVADRIARIAPEARLDRAFKT